MHKDALPAYRRITTATLDTKIKLSCLAGLLSVGTLPWANEMAPDYSVWEVGSPKHGGSGGLNCWTAVLFWAFQGQALTKEWVKKYQVKSQTAATEAILRSPDVGGAGSVAMATVHEKRLKAHHALPVADTDFDAIPPGRIIFFSVPGRNMSHVALSLGAGECVSCWQVRTHPIAFRKGLMKDGFTHVVTIAELKDVCGGIACTVKVPPNPFWDYIKNPS